MITAPLPRVRSIVYGPIQSRRLGSSLGINLLPPDLKLCSFDCAYCPYGWTDRRPTDARRAEPGWLPAPFVVSAVEHALEQGQRTRLRVDRITLAGHGEPTLHPQFPEIVDELLSLRDAIAPGVPVVVLSNSSTTGDPRVRAALAALDERYMKLDAGDENLLHRLNGSRVPLKRLVAGLRALPDVTIQAMFVSDGSGWMDNTTDTAIEQWMVALFAIQPRAVQIETLDHAPAWPYLRPVAAARLQDIARRVRAAGLSAETF